MYVYDDACAACHGEFGGGTEHGPGLIGDHSAAARNTRAQVPCQVGGPSGSVVSDQDLADALAYLREIEDYGGF
jgi:mono/diheme cytochrome c family protein